MTEHKNVVPALNKALEKRGYETLTPVQLAVIEPELSDADMLVSAQTGSGKTVAFGMAFANTIMDSSDGFKKNRTPLALVIAPTRELALQVKRELSWLYEFTGASIASCVGGMDVRDERRALERGVDIVVGTPGRLCDHIKRKALNLSQIKAVVLDEADEMLDLGFKDELEFILERSPDDRRTLMFSATVPRSITHLAKNYQRDAVRINTVAEQKQHLDIEYKALTIAPREQENAISNLLRFYDAKNALVFCATRATVNHMTSRFNNRGFSVVALSGELSQKERSHALQAMRDGRAKVCVATDVAARGIDLPDLELVIHADVPKTKETLLHRSGRTGRAGRKGISAIIVPNNARKRTERLLRDAKITAEWSQPPSRADVLEKDDQRILEHKDFSDTLKDNEVAFAQRILEKYSPEQIAGVLVRQFRKGQSAPEELSVQSKQDRNSDRPSKSRDDFKNGVWFALSVGSKQAAEARWMLPMLCKSAKLQKKDIGAIRVQTNETLIELHPNSVDGFLKVLGKDMRLEKTITVAAIEGTPKFESGGHREKQSGPPRNRPPRDQKKTYSNKKKKSGYPKNNDMAVSQRKKRKKPKKTK